MNYTEKKEFKSTNCAVKIMRLIRKQWNNEPNGMGDEIAEIIKEHYSLPTDKDLAIETIARFTGNSRGVPIEKKGFIDGVQWAKDWALAVPPKENLK